MFGIIRPCRHRLTPALQRAWLSHLCGLCLALRDGHGQAARVATNYDGLIISALVDAQSSASASTRQAGPCALRGMRTATVANGEGAKLAAAVSLVLASAKVRDHVEDGDGALARRPVAAAARRVAGRWDRKGAAGGTAVGFDTALLVDAVERQSGIEQTSGPGTPLLTVTEPTETATAAAFGHTAVLAGRPRNREPLEEAGRLFGRLAHLLDAVEDLTEDRANGAWNPLDATGTGQARARELCADAVHGVKLALRDVEFEDEKLVHALLVHELERSVRRVFGEPEPQRHGHGQRGQGRERDREIGASTPPESPPESPQQPPVTPGYNPFRETPYDPDNPNPPGDPGRPPGRRRGWAAGCGVGLLMFASCKVCCAEEYHNPWTGQPHEGYCRNECCDKCENCSDACDCCDGCKDCCDGCDCCDCGCDCGC
jgi:hypothetical protein